MLFKRMNKRHTLTIRNLQYIYLEFEHFLVEVFRSSPRRTEKHGVGFEIFGYVEEVSEDKLDAIVDAVDGRVVLRQRQSSRVHVNGDHPLARKRQLNRVSSNAAETINDYVATTSAYV